MVVELVIARYNEDISWLSKVKNIKITIYNKGEDNINKKSIKLPNIGRESHTYLTHIIDNYDNLADITIFSQGDPFFHSPDFLKLIKKPELFEPIQPLTYYYSPSINKANNEEKKIIIDKKFRINGMPPTQVLNKTNNLSINGLRIYVEYFNEEGIIMYPKYYRDYFILGLIKYYKKIFNFNNILEFMKKRYKLTNIKLDLLVPMSYAAIFSVSKEVILSRKKSFYENILNLLIEDNIKHNIDTGLLLERLWLSIFNYQKYNKHYVKLYSKDFKINYYKIIPIDNKLEFNINTLSPIYLIITIDKIEYFLIVGFDDIRLKKYNNKINIFNKINNLLKRNEYISIKIVLKKKLEIYINNKLAINVYIHEKNINNIKIEETYEDIKL